MRDKTDIINLLSALLGNYLSERSMLERKIVILSRVNAALVLVGLLSSMVGIMLNFLGIWIESPAIRFIDFANDLIILCFVTLSMLGNLDTKIQIYRSHVRDLTSAADSITRKKINITSEDGGITDELAERTMLYLERMQEKYNSIRHNNSVV